MSPTKKKPTKQVLRSQMHTQKFNISVAEQVPCWLSSAISNLKPILHWACVLRDVSSLATQHFIPSCFNLLLLSRARSPTEAKASVLLPSMAGPAPVNVMVVCTLLNTTTKGPAGWRATERLRSKGPWLIAGSHPQPPQHLVSWLFRKA